MGMGRKLLVVDDEPEFCDFVAKAGSQVGFETTKIIDSREFQEHYLRTAPEVVVVDMVMPRVDGFDILEWLSSTDRPQKIVFVSGYNPVYMRAAAMLSEIKGEFEVYALAKPVSVADLQAVLVQ